MPKTNWLAKELEKASSEVAAWQEWKKTAMRQEVGTIKPKRETVDSGQASGDGREGQT